MKSQYHTESNGETVLNAGGFRTRCLRGSPNAVFDFFQGFETFKRAEEMIQVHGDMTNAAKRIYWELVLPSYPERKTLRKDRIVRPFCVNSKWSKVSTSRSYHTYGSPNEPGD